MRITRTRPGVLTVVAADHEPRRSPPALEWRLSLMRADPDSPAEARESLARVLNDYDRGVARAAEEES